VLSRMIRLVSVSHLPTELIARRRNECPKRLVFAFQPYALIVFSVYFFYQHGAVALSSHITEKGKACFISLIDCKWKYLVQSVISRRSTFSQNHPSSMCGVVALVRSVANALGLLYIHM
jgi:hypothetical protein